MSAKEPTPDCSEIRQRLLEAPHGDGLSEALQQHLERCPTCRTLQAQLLLLDDVTRDQAPELPDGFQLALRRRLDQAASDGQAAGQRETSARRPWLRVALAAAALVIVVGAALLLVARRPDPQPPATYHRLHLAVRSAHPHAEVLVDVELPQGIRALPVTGGRLGRGNKLRWRSRIEQGINEIDLPLAVRGAGGTVRVRLTAGDQVLSGSVRLPGATGSAQTGAQPGARLALVLAAGGAP